MGAAPGELRLLGKDERFGPGFTLSRGRTCGTPPAGNGAPSPTRPAWRLLAGLLSGTTPLVAAAPPPPCNQSKNTLYRRSRQLRSKTPPLM
ncbi:hypothetical protein GN956_G26356 [Arapaima gigas]